jgi:lysozyme
MGIVTEMVFQLGYNGTSKFKKTLGYIKEGSYYQASKEMLDSDWAKQTPERAMSLSKIMANIQ